MWVSVSSYANLGVRNYTLWGSSSSIIYYSECVRKDKISHMLLKQYLLPQNGGTFFFMKTDVSMTKHHNFIYIPSFLKK